MAPLRRSKLVGSSVSALVRSNGDLNLTHHHSHPDAGPGDSNHNAEASDIASLTLPGGIAAHARAASLVNILAVVDKTAVHKQWKFGIGELKNVSAQELQQGMTPGRRAKLVRKFINAEEGHENEKVDKAISPGQDDKKDKGKEPATTQGQKKVTDIILASRKRDRSEDSDGEDKKVRKSHKGDKIDKNDDINTSDGEGENDDGERDEERGKEDEDDSSDDDKPLWKPKAKKAKRDPEDDWKDLTEGLQMNARSRVIRSSEDNSRIFGALPDQEDVEDLMFKPAATTPGKKNMKSKWKLYPGQDRALALKGQSNPGKFTMNLQHVDNPRDNRVMHYQKVNEIDFDDEREVTKLNKWRRQILVRLGLVQANEPRAPWTQFEYDQLVIMITDMLQHNGSKVVRLDWDTITAEMKVAFKDVTQDAGSKLAPSIGARNGISFHNENSVSRKAVTGFSRSKAAIKAQCKRFELMIDILK